MIPDSPDTPLFASWKERRKYALLQAAATIQCFGSNVEDAVVIAERLLSEIESRLPESAE